MTTHISGPYDWPSTTPTTGVIDTWLNAIKTALTTVGLVQTADTGQYTSPVTWPGSSAFITTGYLMFRFNDALQATAPIFLKIRLGRGGNYAYNRRYEITVGTGTDGAGNLTGVISSAMTTTPSSSWSVNNLLQEYACFSNGALFHMSGVSDPTSIVSHWAISIERSKDSSGVPTAEGVSILYKLAADEWRHQALRFTAPTKVGAVNRSFCLLPGYPASPINSNGDFMLYPHFYEMPDIRQRRSTFTVRNSDFASSPTMFTATPVVAEGPHTYLALGTALGNMSANYADLVAYGPVFLWE